MLIILAAFFSSGSKIIYQLLSFNDSNNSVLSFTDPGLNMMACIDSGKETNACAAQ